MSRTLRQESVRVNGLKPREHRFVDEFFIDFLAFPAAVRAGYSEKDTGRGTRLLAQPNIVDEIRRRVLETQARLEIRGDDLRRFHAGIVWDPRTEQQGGPSRADRIAAARELGKLMGLYTVRMQVTGTLSLQELLLASERKAEEVPLLGQH